MLVLVDTYILVHLRICVDIMNIILKELQLACLLRNLNAVMVSSPMGTEQL